MGGDSDPFKHEDQKGQGGSDTKSAVVAQQPIPSQGPIAPPVTTATTTTIAATVRSTIAMPAVVKKPPLTTAAMSKVGAKDPPPEDKANPQRETSSSSSQANSQHSINASEQSRPSFHGGDRSTGSDPVRQEVPRQSQLRQQQPQEGNTGQAPPPPQRPPTHRWNASWWMLLVPISLGVVLNSLLVNHHSSTHMDNHPSSPSSLWAHPYNHGLTCAGQPPQIYHIVLPFPSAPYEEKAITAAALFRHLDKEHLVEVVRSGKKVTEMSRFFGPSDIETITYSEEVIPLDEPSKLTAAKLQRKRDIEYDSMVRYEQLSWYELVGREILDIKRSHYTSGLRHSLVIFTDGIEHGEQRMSKERAMEKVRDAVGDDFRITFVLVNPYPRAADTIKAFCLDTGCSVVTLGKEDSVSDVMQEAFLDPAVQCLARSNTVNYGITLQATRPLNPVSNGQGFEIEVLVRQQSRAGTKVQPLPSPHLQLQVLQDSYFSHTVSPRFQLDDDGQARVTLTMSPYPESQLGDLRPYYTLALFNPTTGDVIDETRFETVVGDYLRAWATKGTTCHPQPNLYIMGMMAAGKSTLVSLIAHTLKWVERGVSLEVHSRSGQHVTRDLNLYDSTAFGPQATDVKLKLASGFGIMDEEGLRGISFEDYLGGRWLAKRRMDVDPKWYQRWLSYLSPHPAHAHAFVVDWDKASREESYLVTVGRNIRRIREAFPHLDPVVVVTHADEIYPQLGEESYYHEYSEIKKRIATKVNHELGVPTRNVFVLTPVMDDSHGFAKQQGAALLVERLLSMAGAYCTTRQ